MQFKPFPDVQPQKRKNNIFIPLIVIGTVLGLCVLCGMIGAVSDALKGKSNSVVIQATQTPSVLTSPSPITSTTLPNTPSELLSTAKTLLGNGSLSGKEEASRYLQAIPKSAKEYKQAQALLAKQNKADNTSGVIATKTPKTDITIQNYPSVPSGLVSRKHSRETSPSEKFLS